MEVATGIEGTKSPREGKYRSTCRAFRSFAAVDDASRPVYLDRGEIRMNPEAAGEGVARNTSVGKRRGK